jgi:hypothetical protein
MGQGVMSTTAAAAAVATWTDTKRAHFWGRVDRREGECWFWLGAKQVNGYGLCAVGRRDDGRQINEQTHRIAYRLTHGTIPDGMYVLHSCDQPPCCNPEHLMLGTQLDNIHDAIHKGRKVGRPGRVYAVTR